MVLGWSINYEGVNGEAKGTMPSQMLLQEVSYPVLMSDLIDGTETAAARKNRKRCAICSSLRRIKPPRWMEISPAGKRARSRL